MDFIQFAAIKNANRRLLLHTHTHTNITLSHSSIVPLKSIYLCFWFSSFLKALAIKYEREKEEEEWETTKTIMIKNHEKLEIIVKRKKLEGLESVIL